MMGEVSRKSFHLLLASFLFSIILCNISHAQTTYSISGYCYDPNVLVGYLFTEGEIEGIALSGNYAYVAANYQGMFVFDISNPFDPIATGLVWTPHIAYDVAVQGNYAYVADWYEGLRIEDISNPSLPTEIGSCDSSIHSAFRILVNGNYAYISDQTTGLHIVDISSTTNPSEVGVIGISGTNNGLALNGHYIYLANSNDVNTTTRGLYIIDVSNVNNPTEVGYYPTYNDTEDVVINGQHAFLANDSGGLQILDISNPINPVEVSQFQTDDYALRITIDSTFAYIAIGNDKLEIIDISDVSNPHKDWTLDIPGGAHELVVKDNYLFAGFRILTKIPGPSVSGINLTLSGDTYLTTTPDTTGYYVFDSLPFGNYTLTPSKYLYVFSPSDYAYSGLSSDQYGQNFTAQPVYTISGYCYSTISTAMSNVSVTLSGDSSANVLTDSNGYYEFDGLINGNYVVTPTEKEYFFTPNQNTYSGLTIDQMNQNFTGIFTTYRISGYCYTDASIIGPFSIEGNLFVITLDGNYALINSRNILNFVDISNPSSPYVFSTYTTPDYIEGITVNGNYAFIADGNSGLRILDISNPSATYEIGSDTSIGNAYSVSLQGDYAYVADYNSGLRILNISNPTSPFEVGAYQIPGYPRVVQAEGNYVYIVGGSTDFYIIDVSNPSSPFAIGSTGQTYYTYNFVIRDNYVYLANEYLTIVDISNPYSPFLVNNTNINGIISGIALDGNIAYLANYEGGFLEYDIRNPLSPVEIYSLGIPDEDDIVGIAVKGDYAYVVSNGSNYYVVNKNNFVSGVQINLAGDTSGTYYTDTTGYYEIDGLLEGNYSVIAEKSSYSFSPFSYGFSDLTTNPSGQNFLGTIYSDTGWNNFQGDFDYGDETNYWGFEIPPNALEQPNISWTPLYAGETGLMVLNFSTDSQGIKMTDKSIVNLSANNWNTLRVKFYCDQTIVNLEVMPLILGYTDLASMNIQEVGASYKDKTMIQGGVWYTMDAPLYSHSSSGQLQLIVRNNGSACNVYIDSIELLNVSPAVVSAPNPTSIPVIFGSFGYGQTLAYWPVQLPPGNNVYYGEGSVSIATYAPDPPTYDGAMVVDFSTTYQGIKSTSLETFPFPANYSGMMTFQVYLPYATPTAIQVLGFLYDFANESTATWDIGGYASIGALAGDTWNTVYVPLTSSNTTDRIQFIIKNTSQYPTTVYVDNVELFDTVVSSQSSLDYAIEQDVDSKKNLKE